MSTIARTTWLRLLRTIGVRQFTATSSLGHRYVCHLGDSLGENPFYNRGVFRRELELCAAWLEKHKVPVIFDVGANVGFWCTHLAQMLQSQSPEIYAFEPAPGTFQKLVASVEHLGLAASVRPIAAAILDDARPVRISYSSWDSQFAQISEGRLNRRVGDRFVYAAGMTLDEFSSALGAIPKLIKIDVEGSEIAVLRGARRLLESSDRPCVLFEYNPNTLSETGADEKTFRELLADYSFHYVDDFEGQKLPLGTAVDSPTDITWVCNLFAVPSTDESARQWASALETARHRLAKRQ